MGNDCTKISLAFYAVCVRIGGAKCESITYLLSRKGGSLRTPLTPPVYGPATLYAHICLGGGIPSSMCGGTQSELV